MRFCSTWIEAFILDISEWVNQEKQAFIISYETRKANMKEIHGMQSNPPV